MKVILKDNTKFYATSESHYKLLVTGEEPKLTADNLSRMEFRSDDETILYGVYIDAEPNLIVGGSKAVFYHGDIVPCKYYITVEGTYVTDGYSDAYRTPSDSDIYIGEGNRTFKLLEEENPRLIDDNGCHIYRYDGSVRKATAEELAEELAAKPKPEPAQPSIEDRISDLEDYTAELLYQQCLIKLGIDDE